MTVKNYRKVANQLKAILDEVLPQDVMMWDWNQGSYISCNNRKEIFEKFDRHFSNDIDLAKKLETCKPERKDWYELEFKKENSKDKMRHHFYYCFIESVNAYAKESNNKDYYKEVKEALWNKLDEVFTK